MYVPVTREYQIQEAQRSVHMLLLLPTEALQQLHKDSPDMLPELSTLIDEILPKPQAQPLQGLITGQMLYDAFGTDEDTIAWKDVSEFIQAPFIHAAAKLNEAHILPLQGRVQEIEGHNRTLQMDYDQAQTQIAELQAMGKKIAALVEQSSDSGLYDRVLALVMGRQIALLEKE